MGPSALALRPLMVRSSKKGSQPLLRLRALLGQGDELAYAPRHSSTVSAQRS